MKNSRPRGFSVDLGEKGIKQTVECIEQLTFNEDLRKKIEEEAGLRGSKMTWDIVGKVYLNLMESLIEYHSDKLHIHH